MSHKHQGNPRRLSSVKQPTPLKARDDKRYALENAGPAVQSRAGKLVGKSINAIAPTRTLSSAIQGVDTPTVASNVQQQIRGTGSEASISGITSAADQYNSYRFDEATALKTYKKMLTIHLKETMFRKLKFITNDAMMEFSRSEKTLCGYVCTQMRVPEYQWGEYWDLVRQPTKKMIEQQRTNATSAIKKGFKGKNNVLQDKSITTTN
jgi:hypothetical protein